MLQKTVFLDRDGTINEEVSYLHKVEDFRFLPGVVEGMKRLYDSGFSLVVLTNQAGIGRGYYPEKDAENVHRFMREALVKEGVTLSGIYYCPHHPEAIPPYKVDCPCRKPKAGLFYQAEWDLLLREKAKRETSPGKSSCAIRVYPQCERKGYTGERESELSGAEEVAFPVVYDRG